jgi:hypothetical protein
MLKGGLLVGKLRVGTRMRCEGGWNRDEKVGEVVTVVSDAEDRGPLVRRSEFC